jgi:uncharacterized protein YlxW (UPF0749 family)
MLDNYDVNARLSRLETLIDSVVTAIGKIEAKLSESSKINWAPIAIGVTIFFTVCGSVATIYNARIATLNTAVEAIANRTLDLEKGNVASQLKTQTLEERVSTLEKNVDHMQDDQHRSDKD